MPESALVSLCIQWLWRHGCYVWRNNTGAYKPSGTSRYIRYGFKGSPDILGVTPEGRFIGVECKVGKNKLSKHQTAFQDRVQQRNGIYVVARSLDDLDAIKAQLKGVA